MSPNLPNPLGPQGPLPNDRSGRDAGLSLEAVARAAAVSRLQDLLADKATVGLDPLEQMELNRLCAQLGVREDGSFEHAAAVLDRALAAGTLSSSSGVPQASPEVMPADVRQRLLEKGRAWMREARWAEQASRAELLRPQVAPEPVRRSVLANAGEAIANAGDALADAGERIQRRVSLWVSAVRSFPIWGGWTTAAAVLVIGALVVTRNTPSIPGEPNKPNSEAAGVAFEQTSELVQRVLNSPLALYQRLTGERTASESLLEASAEPAQLPVQDRPMGRVYFDRAKQEGVVVVSGLPVVRGEESQWQLWIRDAARPDGHLISAGLGETPLPGPTYVLPARPAIPVERPTQIILTLEKRGGVVQSSPERAWLIFDLTPSDNQPENPPGERDAQR